MLIDQCHAIGLSSELANTRKKEVLLEYKVKASCDIGPAFNEHKQGRITCFAF